VLYTPQGPRTPEGFAAARERALKTSANIDRMVGQNYGKFGMAYTAADAARIARQGKRVVYKSIENSYPLGLDVDALDEFYRLGVRIVGPVHGRNNDWADSATDAAGPEWNGLSPRGVELVKRANKLGIVLDGSHASDATIAQMIELSKSPIILTHHGMKAVYDHPRNITDDLARKLAASGGVIQMNSLYSGPVPAPSAERVKALADLNAKYGPRDKLAPDKLVALNAELAAINEKYPAPKASLDDYLKQIDHALEVVGPNHVGFGADWDGGGGVVGLEDVSMLPKITQHLRDKGYSQRDLQKMWSGNVLRLLREAEQEAAREARAAR
jgi:membrane dipeptidase